MPFDHQTLNAAIQGAAYAVPLLLCSLAGRTLLFKATFPVLEEMHESQHDTLDHVIEGEGLKPIAVRAQMATYFCWHSCTSCSGPASCHHYL